MIEFMKKAMDWVLEKEADMAKNYLEKLNAIKEERLKCQAK